MSETPPPQLAPLPADDGGLIAKRNLGPLLLILLAALPALLISLGQRDVTRVMENVSIGSSQETWHQVMAPGNGGEAGDLSALILPVWNGKPRLVKPPMLVWVNIAAAELTGHSPQTTSADRFILICRVVTVGFGLLAIASTYWVGLTLGDRKLAILAAAVFATMWCAVRASRTASYDGHLLGYATFAIAAALYALAPLRDSSPSLKKQILGWGLATLAVTGAILTKGPLALVVVVLPIAAMGVVMGRRWKSLVLGLTCVMLVSGGAFAGWYSAVQQMIPELGDRLATEYAAQRDEAQPLWYYVMVIVMVVPWSGWLVAGAVHPLVNAWGKGQGRGRGKRLGYKRRLRLIPWAWFAVLLVFFSIPMAKQQRYILPLIPAAALLCALVMRDHLHMVKLGRPDPGAWVLQRPVGAIAVLGAVLFPGLLAGQPWLVQWGWIDDLNLAALSIPVAAGLVVVLLGLAIPAERMLRKHRVLPGVLWLAGWMTVVTATANHAYAVRSAADDPTRENARRIVALAGGDRVVYFLPDQPTQALIDDEEPLLIHLQRAVPSWTLEKLSQASPAELLVITEPTDAAAATLQELGYTHAFDFLGDKQTPRAVFRAAE